MALIVWALVDDPAVGDRVVGIAASGFICEESEGFMGYAYEPEVPVNTFDWPLCRN